MNLSLYRDEDTWLHRLDPRTKMVGVLIVFTLCLCFNHPFYVAGLTSGVFLIAVSSRSNPVLWNLRHILILLVLFSTVLWPFFIKGPTTIWTWKMLTVSRESLFYGIAMGLRLATFVMTGLIFLATTRNEEIANGLIRMGLPYPIAFALVTAIRLVPTFAGAGATIVQAQVSRGLDLESKNIFARLASFIPLAVPMFITAIRYTNLLAMALESRGFSPVTPRTFSHIPRMGKKDRCLLFLLSFLLAIALYLRLVCGLGVVISGRL
jgi:energy-coupling factor transport system permease protein